MPARKRRCPSRNQLDAIGSMYAQDDGITYQIRVWTDREWAAMAAGRRPKRHAYFPGLGWVGLVPDPVLNN
jgi:hypothetical protein